MNKTKGFTLIEIMGVIIIIGLLGLLAFPPIINQIKNSKSELSKVTLELIYAANSLYIDQNIYNYPKYEGNVYCISLQTLVDDGKLQEPLVDSVTGENINLNKVVRILYETDNKYINEVVNSDECAPIDNRPKYVDTSGANVPQLVTGMTPIIWNGTDWVEATNISDPYTQNWYNYGEKKWANAKTADGSYWVWIPRYAYKITSGYHSSTAGTIDIKFLTGKTNTTKDGTKIETNGYVAGVKDTSMHYFLHPAFQFDGEELGFWVAKFEPTAVEGVATITGTCNAEDDLTTKTVKLIPNATSWRCITIGNAYTVVKNMKNNSVYGWDANAVDTHMMKNSEWGAVAYLSKSIYGTNTEQIWNNSYNQYKTGCSGSVINASNESNCVTYDTTDGQKASTTHNIYGVYDMAGGAWERVAGYLNNGHSNLQFYGSSLVTEVDSKYKNIYLTGTTDNQENNYEANKNIYGDAIYETSSNINGAFAWNADYSYMLSYAAVFFHRGGNYAGGSGSGAFGSGNPYGDAVVHATFRPVFFVK